MAEVAAGELTVVFSSHAIAELEPVCDHLVLLGAARTQLTGDIDDLLAAHRLLVGPRRDLPEDGRIAGHQIIAASHAERQTSVLVRLSTPWSAGLPGWTQRDMDLASLVLAYMRHPEAGAPERPELHAITREESSWAG
jgi:ABC-2 type transport system ATP-binding protein